MYAHRTIGMTGIAVLAFAAAAGCAKTYQQNHVAASRYDHEKLVVAVMPFQGVSESPGSGLIVADIMANELYTLGGYTVVTPEVVTARTAAREGETLSPAETGKIVGAPLILTGRVTEYTYKSGVGEQPAVGVTARLIESDTGRVIWSAIRAKTGSAAWFQEDSLALLTSRVCRSLAYSLNGESIHYNYGSLGDEYTVQGYPLPPQDPKPAPKAPAQAPARPAAAQGAATPAPARPAAPPAAAASTAAPASATATSTSANATEAAGPARPAPAPTRTTTATESPRAARTFTTPTPNPVGAAEPAGTARPSSSGGAAASANENMTESADAARPVTPAAGSTNTAESAGATRTTSAADASTDAAER